MRTPSTARTAEATMWIGVVLFIAFIVTIAVLALQGYSLEQRFQGACTVEGGTRTGTVGKGDLVCIDGDTVLFDQAEFEKIEENR